MIAAVFVSCVLSYAGPPVVYPALPKTSDFKVVCHAIPAPVDRGWKASRRRGRRLPDRGASLNWGLTSDGQGRIRARHRQGRGRRVR